MSFLGICTRSYLCVCFYVLYIYLSFDCSVPVTSYFHLSTTPLPTVSAAFHLSLSSFPRFSIHSFTSNPRNTHPFLFVVNGHCDSLKHFHYVLRCWILACTHRQIHSRWGFYSVCCSMCVCFWVCVVFFVCVCLCVWQVERMRERVFFV